MRKNQDLTSFANKNQQNTSFTKKNQLTNSSMKNKFNFTRLKLIYNFREEDHKVKSQVKSEIKRNIGRDRSIEQIGFLDYSEKLGDTIVEAEDKNINMIIDKLHENEIYLRRQLQRLDQSLNSALSLQKSNQAKKKIKLFHPRRSQISLLISILEYEFLDVNSWIDDELLKEIKKNYDPVYFRIFK